MVLGVGITTGWGETEVFMEVSSRRLAIVQHRHLPARGLLSLISLLRAFPLNVIKRNQALVFVQALRSRAAGAQAATPTEPRHKEDSCAGEEVVQARARARPSRPLSCFPVSGPFGSGKRTRS